MSSIRSSRHRCIICKHLVQPRVLWSPVKIRSSRVGSKNSSHRLGMPKAADIMKARALATRTGKYIHGLAFQAHLKQNLLPALPPVCGKFFLSLLFSVEELSFFLWSSNFLCLYFYIETTRLRGPEFKHRCFWSG